MRSENMLLFLHSGGHIRGAVTLFPLQIRQPRITRKLEGHIRVHDDIDKAGELFGHSI